MIQYNALRSNTYSSNTFHFPCLNSSLFRLKVDYFVEEIRGFNTDSSNYSPLFTYKKRESTRKKTNLRSVDQNFLMFVLL